MRASTARRLALPDLGVAVEEVQRQPAFAVHAAEGDRLLVAQHPPDEPHVGELRRPFRFPVAFIEYVLRFDINPELGRCLDSLRDRRVQSVQAIEQENFVLFQLYGFVGNAPALLEAIDRFLDGLPLQQTLEMAIEQLDVQCFRRFIVAIVDPVGGMLNE